MAENLSVQAAFVAAGAGAILGALAGLRRLAVPDLPDVEPLRYWPEPELALEPEPRAGPVLVTVEWRIDPARREEFAEAMRPVERARRQTGATRWGLFQDAALKELVNDLALTVLAAVGVCLAATLAVLEELSLFRDVLIGAGAGAIVGKLIVGWRERGGRQIDDWRRRQLEVRWISVGAGAALVVYLVVELR